MRIMIALALFVTLPLMAYASKTTTAVTSTGKIKSKPTAKHLIKNSELRAWIGSMSKLSVSTNLKYSGASLEDPFGKERPNPNGWGGDWSTRLSGSVSGRYRINKMQSLTTGFGLSARKPFHGMEQAEWKNPFLGHSFAQRFTYLSGYFSTSVTKYSQLNDKRLGKNLNLYAGYTLKWTRINKTAPRGCNSHSRSE